MSRSVIKVAVTGGAGQIGYSILPRIASGEVFGPNTKIHLHLLEVTPALKALEGVVMELDDCAFPLLEKVVISDDAKTAFDGVNWAIFVGAAPRKKGMERGDLIRTNGPIFVGQGQALARAASDVMVLVVGNPANTNALIAMNNAKSVPPERFTALTMLDHNRAVAQLAKKGGVPVTDVSNVAIWGNHSATQYPDFENAKIRNKPLTETIGHVDWLKNDFLKMVQQRGAAIIEARGASSAMSAANAALDHVRAFESKTPAGQWFSACVRADGSYGIDKGLIFSFPIQSEGAGKYKIVQGLKWSDWAKKKIEATTQELREEKAVVEDLLK